jgi:hypothetical protein
MEKSLRVVNTLALLGILAVLVLILVRLPQLQQKPLTLGDLMTVIHGKNAVRDRLSQVSNPAAAEALFKSPVVIVSPLNETSW